MENSVKNPCRSEGNMKTFLYEMHKKINLYVLFFGLIMILLPVSAAKAEEREIRGWLCQFFKNDFK